MIVSNFELEKKLLDSGYGLVIGIDEAGRGPLAGPVVAAAALFKLSEYPVFDAGDDPLPLVRDSKTLSARQREKAFDIIRDKFHVGIGVCDHRTIDRINILEAAFLAMKKAVGELLRNLDPSSPSSPYQGEKKRGVFRDARKIVLVDGNKLIPNFSHEQKAIVNGDKKVKSISAASIVAKVTRDRMMLEMHGRYPEYGFDRHKGYGTKFHMEMIGKHGPSEIHRSSFEPLSSLAKVRKG